MKKAVTKWVAYILSALMIITGIGVMPAASMGEVHADTTIGIDDTVSFAGSTWYVVNPTPNSGGILVMEDHVRSYVYPSYGSNDKWAESRARQKCRDYYSTKYYGYEKLQDYDSNIKPVRISENRNTTITINNTKYYPSNLTVRSEYDSDLDDKVFLLSAEECNAYKNSGGQHLIATEKDYVTKRMWYMRSPWPNTYVAYGIGLVDENGDITATDAANGSLYVRLALYLDASYFTLNPDTSEGAAKWKIDELAPVKNAAQAALETAYNAINNSDDYDAEGKAEAQTIYNAGVAAIGAATIADSADAPQDNGAWKAEKAAEAEFATIKTKAVKLAEAKAAAKTTLAEYRTSKTDADYDDDGVAALNTAKTDGDAAIEAATTVEDVSTALQNAKAAIDAVKTIAQKLAEAKAAAKDELDALIAGKSESDFDPTDWADLTNAISDGKNAIDAATTIEDVDLAKKNAVVAVAQILARSVMKPAAKTDLQYTGSAMALVNAPSETVVDYTVNYSTDNGETWSTEIPTGTAVATYKVKVKYASGTYDDFDGAEITVRINKANPKDSLTDNQKPTANKDGENNRVYTGEPIALVKAPTAPTDGYEVQYSTDDGETWSAEIPKKINAGDYEVHVKYYPTDGNHQQFYLDDPIEVTIDKANTTITADKVTVTGAGVVPSDGQSHSATVSVSETDYPDAVIRYSETAGGPYDLTTAPSYTEGTHTVYYQIVEDNNHHAYTGSMTITLTSMGITDAEGNPLTGAPQFGQTLKANMVPEKAGTTYQWVRIDGQTQTDIASATSSTYTLVKEDIGKTITVKVTPPDESAITLDPTATVVKADNTVAPVAADTITVTHTDTGITVTAPTNDKYEYGYKKTGAEGDYTWNAAASFTDLDPGTAYDVVVREKETATHEAGPASEVKQVTTYVTVTINGSPVQGQTVDVSLTPETTGVTYKWYINDKPDGTGETIVPSKPGKLKIEAYKGDVLIGTAETADDHPVKSIGELINGSTSTPVEVKLDGPVNTDIVIPEGKEVVLDLNGNDVNKSIIVYGALTILDTSNDTVEKQPGIVRQAVDADTGTGSVVIRDGCFVDDLLGDDITLEGGFYTDRNFDETKVAPYYFVRESTYEGFTKEVYTTYVALETDAPTVTITKAAGNTDQDDQGKPKPQIGDTLTAATNPVSANPVEYQWYRGSDPEEGVAIEGATEKDYLITAADVGEQIYVIVTQPENADGEGSPAVTTQPSTATDEVAKKTNTKEQITPNDLKAKITKTDTSITVKPVLAGYEYTVVAKGSDPTSEDWKTAETGQEAQGLSFGEFTRFTEYDVLVRAKGDEQTKPGETTKVTVKTDVTISISDNPVQGKKVTVTIDPAPQDPTDITYAWCIGDNPDPTSPDGTGDEVIPTRGGVLTVYVYEKGDPDPILIGTKTFTDQTKTVKTLKDYISDQENPVEITLDGPVTGGIEIPENKKVEIDLKGNTVGGNITVHDDANLTLKDSSNDKTGKVEGNLIVGDDDSDEKGGTVTIEGGRYNPLPTIYDPSTVTYHGGFFLPTAPAVVDPYVVIAPHDDETYYEVYNTYVPLDNVQPTVSLTKTETNKETNTPQVGDTLTAGTTPTDARPITYQWYRGRGEELSNYDSIENATDKTYVLTGDDVGQTIRVKVVQAADAGGQGTAAVEPAPSDSTETVQLKTNPAAEISEDTLKGQIKKADTTVTIDPATTGYEYAVVKKGDDPTDEDWKPAAEGGVGFTGLDPDTEYDVFVRSKGDNTMLPGDPTKTTIKTDVSVIIGGTPVQGETVTVTFTPAQDPDEVTYAWCSGDTPDPTHPDSTAKDFTPDKGGKWTVYVYLPGDPDPILIGTKEFTVKTLEEVINTSTDDPVVIKLKGTITGDIDVPEDKNVKIDLNGNDVTGDFKVKDGAKLTIEDTSENDPGTVKGTVKEQGDDKGGEVTIKGGRYDNMPTVTAPGEVVYQGGFFPSAPTVVDPYLVREPHDDERYYEVYNAYKKLEDVQPTITLTKIETNKEEEDIPQVGDTLTAGTTPTDARPVTYQWYRGETPIGGATGKTYEITDTDVGEQIHVVVTQPAGADGGTSPEVKPADSDDTKPVVLKTNPAPEISEETLKGQIKKADTTVTIDPASPGYEYAVVEKGEDPTDDDWKPASEGGVKFTGLDPDKEYDVVVRSKGDDTMLPGDPTKTIIKTDVTVTISDDPVQGETLEVTFTPEQDEDKITYAWCSGENPDPTHPDSTDKDFTPDKGGKWTVFVYLPGVPDPILIGTREFTVKSLDDVIETSTDDPVVIKLDGPVTGDIEIPTDKNVRIDLNGNDIDGDILVKDGAKVTIEDKSDKKPGTVKGTVKEQGDDKGGEVVIKGGRYDHMPTTATPGEVIYRGGFFPEKPTVRSPYKVKDPEAPETYYEVFNDFEYDEDKLEKQISKTSNKITVKPVVAGYEYQVVIKGRTPKDDQWVPADQDKEEKGITFDGLKPETEYDVLVRAVSDGSTPPGEPVKVTVSTDVKVKLPDEIKQGQSVEVGLTPKQDEENIFYKWCMGDDPDPDNPDGEGDTIVPTKGGKMTVYVYKEGDPDPILIGTGTTGEDNPVRSLSDVIQNDEEDTVDVQLDGPINSDLDVPEDKDVTLDLNGNDVNEDIYVADDATLVIEDTGDKDPAGIVKGDINVGGDKDGDGEGGTVIIKSGRFDSVPNVEEPGKAILEGGEFKEDPRGHEPGVTLADDKEIVEDETSEYKYQVVTKQGPVDEVKEEVNALPDSDKVTTADKDAIEKARKDYEALSDDQKALVDDDTLKKLKDAETALKAAQEKEARINQMGEDGTPLGKGASFEAANAAILKKSANTSNDGARILPIKLRSAKQTKKAININWTKPSGAVKYVLYGNKCGKKTKMKLIATVTGKAKKVNKVAGKKLKKGTYYKFMVVALDSKNNVVSTSKMIYVATKGKNSKSNPTGIKVKAKVSKKGKKLNKYKTTKAIALKKGKATKLKSQIKKKKDTKVKRYSKVRYESTNPKVATVSFTGGRVKAVSKGKTKIVAYTQNGKSRTIKVTVK